MDNELGLPLEDPIRKLENIDGNWMPNGNVSTQYNPHGIERRSTKQETESSPQAREPKVSNQGQIGQDMWK